MSKRNLSALLLTIASVGLLIPGIVFPILSIDIGAKIPLLGEMSLHYTKQSILQTIQSLFKANNGIVGFLIFFFSLFIPFAKAFLVFISIFSKSQNAKLKIKAILSIIGKWSMADVFVVALFIAFLSTSSEDYIDANIHIGFYYFLGYCILSIIGFQMMKFELSK